MGVGADQTRGIEQKLLLCRGGAKATTAAVEINKNACARVLRNPQVPRAVAQPAACNCPPRALRNLGVRVHGCSRQQSPCAAARSLVSTRRAG